MTDDYVLPSVQHQQYAVESARRHAAYARDLGLIERADNADRIADEMEKAYRRMAETEAYRMVEHWNAITRFASAHTPSWMRLQ